MDQERKQKGKDIAKNPAQLPETDPDSRVMPNKEGGFAPNFTPVTAVDTHMGFIVYATVLQDVNEHTHAQTVVTTIQADFEIRPARMLTDGLNSTGQNLAAFENSGTELISPLAEAAPAGPNPAVRADPTQPVPEAEWPLLPRSPQKQLDKSCFQYDAEKDVYHCPQGKTLHYEETKPKVLAGDQKLDVRIYRCAECEGCPLAKACLSAKNVHGRTVSRDEYTEHRERHAARMERPEAKEAYKRRLHAGETPFAHIKHVFGLRQFLLRGLEKVETEWLWACTTYNLMKLIRYLSKQRRESAQQVAMKAV
jgi:Transposase DDE domain